LGLDMGATVEHKDVVITLLGASAGLAGLALVFLGLVAAATGSYPPGTKPEIIARKRRPAWAVLLSFGLGVLCVSTAAWWLLLLHDDRRLYIGVTCLFFAQLVALVVATIWTMRHSLWG
jgi:hypothetical protein